MAGKPGRRIKPETHERYAWVLVSDHYPRLGFHPEIFVPALDQSLVVAGPGRGWVYFIECPSLGRVKIGQTHRSVKDRLDALKIGSPVNDLRIASKMHGDHNTERFVHARFSAFRSHGEWFEYAPEIRKLTDWLNDLTAKIPAAVCALPALPPSTPEVLG
ncbi:MAG: GIY-YIG nuclease family protein [Acidobacteriota bacterium]|nr:GIY-YIG nuclease family protein [Acidobacteriota bacterium]